MSHNLGCCISILLQMFLTSQESKRLSSWTPWKYEVTTSYHESYLLFFFFSSLEYLGIEWITKSFILETENYYASFPMNISFFFFQVVQEVYVSSTWTLAGLHLQSDPDDDSAICYFKGTCDQCNQFFYTTEATYGISKIIPSSITI